MNENNFYRIIAMVTIRKYTLVGVSTSLDVGFEF